MSKVIRIETNGDKTTIVTEVDLNQTLPSGGWQRGEGSGPGPDGCVIENLLTLGLDPSDGIMMFVCHDPETRRLDLSHNQDTADIVEHCRKHGITVEPGVIIDDASDRLGAGVVRVFRDWRMSGTGCSWATGQSVMTSEDGQPACRVCGQVIKPVTVQGC